MLMREVAHGVTLLAGRPAHRINQYLVGDTLIDAGTPAAARRLLRSLNGRHIAAHALTHAHPDHYGASRAVAERLDVPVACPEGDVEAIVSRRPPHADHPLARLLARVPAPPPPRVARRLREGDIVAGFRVLETPGHTPGHVSYWRETDRVLIVGDALFNADPITGRTGLREPPAFATVDVPRNRQTIRRLAALAPAIALFGHGPPLMDPTRLHAVAAALG
jgi:hydroxyacylglutathione hydrolase